MHMEQPACTCIYNNYMRVCMYIACNAYAIYLLALCLCTYICYTIYQVNHCDSLKNTTGLDLSTPPLSLDNGLKQ